MWHRAARPATAASAGAGAAPEAPPRNILIAVDGSADSEYACEWVLAHLLRRGSDVLHVASCVPYFPAVGGFFTMDDGRVAALDIERMLEQVRGPRSGQGIAAAQPGAVPCLAGHDICSCQFDLLPYCCCHDPRAREQEDRHLAQAEARMQEWCSKMLGGRGVHYIVEILREDPATVGDRSMIGKAICEKAELLDVRGRGREQETAAELRFGRGSRARANEWRWRRSSDPTPMPWLHSCQASAVVIASHAKSALSEFILGSVADHCIHHCSAPVLVLHAPQGPGALSRLASRVLGRQPAAASSLSSSGLVTSGDFSSDEPNLFGLTADAPGIGSQSAAAFDAPSALVGPGLGERGAPLPRAAAAAEGAAEGAAAAEGGRRILLAVDDSPASDKACVWTLENVVRLDDTVVLLHIIPTLPVRAMWGGPVDGAVFYMEPLPVHDFAAASDRDMEHRFEPKLKAAGVAYQKEILLEATEASVQGIGQAICDRAAAEGAAVVVLGSHTRAGLQEFLLGSVTSYTAHNCEAPVAVLHP
eukprot:scaffold17.g531.t1